MSSSDDTRPPRRPQPDRDSFYDKHARSASRVVADSGGELPETIIIDGSSAAELPTVEFTSTAADPAGEAGKRASAPDHSGSEGPDDALPAAENVPARLADDAPPVTERVSATRIDVRSAGDAVVTEPFTDAADGDDADARERRAPAHLTEDPLPYIEPTHTAPLVIPDDEADVAGPPAAYSEVPADRYDDDLAVPMTVPGRGTLDLGLLILRVVVGLVFFFHGLQKLTTWRGGFGVDGFAAYLTNSPQPSLGFNSDAAHTLALVAGLSESIGGVLLVLGLLTPIAGSAVLGVIIVAMTYKVTLAGGLWFFAAQGNGNGIEYELVLAATSIAIILCGPGTYSFDRRWGWARRPAWGSFAWLIIAIAASVALWIVFNGANPLARA
ncbi:DoxX family protein [Gordonia sp. FQ]|uniref:DoxX family protein n=1 Tax=Gordonia sp. FQ TaxID=3446634 RepID=UPI003F86CAAD